VNPDNAQQRRFAFAIHLQLGSHRVEGGSLAVLYRHGDTCGLAGKLRRHAGAVQRQRQHRRGGRQHVGAGRDVEHFQPGAAGSVLAELHPVPMPGRPVIGRIAA